jgi:hypothetical protein
VKGLVVADKTTRVASFHRKTVESFVELMAGAGLDAPGKINRSSISRRVFMNQVKRYDEIYPYLEPGCLLSELTAPEDWRELLAMAQPNTFAAAI